MIPVLSRTSLRVITSSLLRPEGGVSMRTDGQDGNLEHWRDLYTAALVELSSDKLPQRIRDAQRAIVDEIECRGGFQMEHQALLDACWCYSISKRITGQMVIRRRSTNPPSFSRLCVRKTLMSDGHLASLLLKAHYAGAAAGLRQFVYRGSMLQPTPLNGKVENSS